MCFRSCRKFKNLNFLTFCSQGMHKFYCIFVQFMQFPVFDFGLVHFTSQPFMCAFDRKKYLIRLSSVYVLLHHLLLLLGLMAKGEGW